MRRVITTLLLMAGTLVVPAISASAQTESGGVGIRLLEAPTEREKDPRAQRSVVDHVKPGASFTRKFEVTNTTNGQRLISIYAAAADVVGGAFVPADGRTQNELSGWITIDTANADLAAGRSVQPKLTVSVPPTASAGERYAVVWAELPPAKPPAGGVAVVNRVGLRIYLSVGPGGEPKTDFVIESLTAGRDTSRRPVVQATVRNTGGRALDLNGKLTLAEGPGGLSAGPFPANLGTTLAIGAAAPVTIPLDPSLPAGPWRARIELTSSTTTRTSEAVITFPDAAGTSGEPVTAEAVDEEKSSSVLPLVLAIVGGLVLLGVLLLVFLLTRRRRTAPPTVALPLDAVLTELRTAEGARKNELMGMAAAYGKEAIMASPELKALPVQTARDLGERVARAGR
jgi:hypothetical protein